MVERVQQLAPDSSSAKAGQGLATARHWISFATDGDALWGECQGSGAKPYQVRVDLGEPAFKCSCPSRKFPCKHAIGLMLMFVGGSVSQSARPEWVAEWFAERTARIEKKREKADAPPRQVDAHAQLKRREERLERVAEGLAGLKLWLHDLARIGIASIPSRGYGFFDEQARRLVDAQAPGVARRVQLLASIASSGSGWQRLFLEQLSLLYLLTRGFECRATLPEAARDVLLSVIGIPRSQDEVLATPGIADRWQIIAQEVVREGQIRAQHTWLLGANSGQLAHLLAFAHGVQPLDTTLPPGFAFDGEVCFYPGEGLRALVKDKAALAPFSHVRSGIDLDALLDQYAARRALNPWLEGFAVPLASAVPISTSDGWALADASGQCIVLKIADAEAWKLVAVSGGSPIDVVVYFDGRHARPLAAFAAGEQLRLRTGNEEEA